MAQRKRIKYKIALHSNDKTTFPNLALMKISAWHKSKGDSVGWFNSMLKYDTVYSSKVFTWTKADPYLPDDTVYGGTGVDITSTIPQAIESLCPDYSLYGLDYSLGFLTRGCIRKCEWCFVPSKEGRLRPHHDIEVFTRHKNVVLMDNNFLACGDYTIEQIGKIAKLGLKVDFNQGLDARLIDASMAKQLAKMKWLKPLRLACDSQTMKEPIERAVKHLREANVTPKAYFVYTLVKDVPEALDRVEFLKSLNLDPFAQPYRDKEGTKPTNEQKKFARWVNHKAIFKTVPWGEYS